MVSRLLGYGRYERGGGGGRKIRAKVNFKKSFHVTDGGTKNDFLLIFSLHIINNMYNYTSGLVLYLTSTGLLTSIFLLRRNYLT